MKKIYDLNKKKEIEKEFYDKGMYLVAGADEVGRGPLAGPVVVGAVILPKDSFIEGINDSKKISPNQLFEKWWHIYYQL